MFRLDSIEQRPQVCRNALRIDAAEFDFKNCRNIDWVINDATRWVGRCSDNKRIEFGGIAVDKDISRGNRKSRLKQTASNDFDGEGTG